MSKIQMSIFFIYISLLILSDSVQSRSKSLDPDCVEKWPECTINGYVYVNTACERRGCGPRFRGCTERKPDAEFRQAILDKHNELRNKLASSGDTRGGNEAASNMMVLSYDLGLEFTAICQVHGCSMNHDQCRSTKEFQSVGQNLAMFGKWFPTIVTQANVDEVVTIETIKSLIQGWYDEIGSGDFKSIIDRYSYNFNTGHFTQLVWATTTHVGCAMAVDRSNKYKFSLYLTCNYAPAGNMLGGSIYAKGAGCSKCPEGVSCNTKYSSLCGEIDDIGSGENPFRAADIARGGQKILYSHIMPLHNLIFLLFLVKII